VVERDVGNDWLGPFVITARWIGTRRNELLRLERRQLDLETGKITLDVGSTKIAKGGLPTCHQQLSRPSASGTRRPRPWSEIEA